MSKQVVVEKIEIKIGRKVLSLSPSELRELRDVLNKTFPEVVAPAPIIIERPAWPRPERFWRDSGRSLIAAHARMERF